MKEVLNIAKHRVCNINGSEYTQGNFSEQKEEFLTDWGYLLVETRNIILDNDVALRLLIEGFRRFHAWAGALPNALHDPLSTMESAWRAALGEAGPEGLFLGPKGTPAFQLLAWVSESLLPDPVSESSIVASEAMIAQYLAARIQDDIVDEGAPRDLVYLMQTLSARALMLSVEASGHAEPMLRLWEESTRDFDTAALVDAHLRSNYAAEWTEETLALQGKKYLPMAMPLAALCLKEERARDIPQLLELVETLAVGLQLQNDFLGALHDLSTGLSSPYLIALGLKPTFNSPDDLSPAIARSLDNGAYLQFVARIEQSFEDAEAHLEHFSSGRLAKHLLDRKRLLKSVRTRQLVESVLRPASVVLDLELTRLCNLHCDVCFVRVHDTFDSISEPVELPVDLALEVVDELKSYDSVLHITGGEPFMYEGLWKVLERAEKLGVREVTINTNGTLLDAKTLESLGSLRLDVQLLISVDGPAGVHESTRGAQSFSKALFALETATRWGVRASPASILTRELVQFGLRKWRSWLYESIGEFCTIVLWPLFVLEGGPSTGHLVGTSLRPEDVVDAARQIAAMYRAGEDVVIADYPIINPLLQRLGVPDDRLWQCRAGSQRLCVQADGSISPCHPLRSQIGKLESGKVAGFVSRSFQHPLSRALQARHHEGCSECADRPICGSCQAAVAGRSLPFSSNDWTCRRALEFLESHDISLMDAADEMQSVQI